MWQIVQKQNDYRKKKVPAIIAKHKQRGVSRWKKHKISFIKTKFVITN